MIIDEFHTIGHECESEIKVKGSRFIGTACPAASRDEAEHFIARISKKYFDATHHGYAWHIGLDEAPVFRFHDDGEPSGTAGKPIHQAILSRRLTHIAIVVTRYFGGTKLGTGGLARAYGDCAVSVLDRCTITKIIRYEKIRFGFPYEETDTVMRLIHTLGGVVIETRYDDTVQMLANIRLREVDHFKNRLTDVTRGKAVIFSKE
jgi:uncharacterized YigZ family protein